MATTEHEIEASPEPCPRCGDPTFDTTPHWRPDAILRVCLECGWERLIVFPQPDSATDQPN